MSIENYQQLFWNVEIEGNTLDVKVRSLINERLREMYYQLGFKRIKALEGLDSLVKPNKIYPVHLVKDEYFPQGEEAIIGESGEYITLACFKHKTLA